MMKWTFPVARAAANAVVIASQTIYTGLADSEANAQRFKFAVDMVMANKEARDAIYKAMSAVFLGWLSVASPLVRVVAQLVVEAAYQAMKAASKPSYITNSWGDAEAAKAILKERDSFAVETPPVVISSVIDAKPTGAKAFVSGTDIEVVGPVGSWDEGPIPSMVLPPAPETIVGDFEQAEPGDTR
jgi:hypothetical protein